MSLYAWPVVYALFVWWFSTGAVLYIMGLPRTTFRWSMAAATLVLAAAFYGLFATNDDASVTGAFVAFTCAILIWGWHEMSFLTGMVTGPRTTPLPKGASGGARLMPAIETLIYHELAIFLTVLAIGALTAGGENEVGFWTFIILWVMRLSAKLNLFLGVPNLADELLPDHLAYLASYFRKRRMNLLFPVSVTGGSVVTALLISAAVDPAASDFAVTSATFLATLLALAVLEHWFMVIELPTAALWNWGLSSREARHSNDNDQIRPQEDKTSCPVTVIA
jgi:putative photosynthetic complex assembly protein 2